MSRVVVLLFVALNCCSMYARLERDSSDALTAETVIKNMTLAHSFGRRQEEVEIVRSLLSKHREMLGRKLGELLIEDGNSESNTEDQPDTPESGIHHAEEGFGNDQIHRTAPEILHVNKQLKDYLYQGDMALTAEQAKFLFENRFRRQSLNGKKYPEFKWPRNISYSFDNSLNEATKKIIQKALDFWADNTCLNFHENDEASTKLAFTKADGCWSYVGKVSDYGEPQPISIGEGCEHFAVATHEIAHALGFFHAQSRYDRDTYVRFKVRNVASGFEDQFAKEGPQTNNNYGVKYDYGSVLHYSDNAFAKSEKLPVLIATESHNQNTMGQRIKPSFSDVLVMNLHYGCLSKCVKKKIKCKNGGYVHPKNCSKCICPWGFGGDSCKTRQQATGPAISKKCGGIVSAKLSWADLNATVGSTEKTLFSEHSSCHFHIKAPKGKHVQLKLLSIGRVCSSGCFYGNTEFKISKDFRRTGLRMCCASDVRGRPVLTSETNLAVISLYTRFFLQSFRLQYRYV